MDDGPCVSDVSSVGLGDHLSTLDQLQVGKWHKYMAIKDQFYKSYVRRMQIADSD